MTLQQLTMEAMAFLPESKKLQVLNFAKSLNTAKTASDRISSGIPRRKCGILRGRLRWRTTSMKRLRVLRSTCDDVIRYLCFYMVFGRQPVIIAQG